MTVELSESQLENRVLWVRDLLSGDFEQGNGRLMVVRDDNVSYCCLGVACKRFEPNSDRLRLADHGGGVSKSVGAYMADTTAALLGLVPDDQAQAGRWNDIHKYSFERIADLVAYATSEKHRFSYVAVDAQVPEGYAVEWLKQFD